MNKQDFFYKLMATWFGSGLLKPASGTWGSLAALPFAWLILTYGDKKILFLCSAAIFIFGVWVSNNYIKGDKEADPSEVVIDEVAGQWITLLTIASMSWLQFALAFGLFRFFDALKPFPISWFDRNIHGGLGIMLDDVVAGIIAGLVLYGYNMYFG